eukprot:4948991-Pyramimonas_sp.AAC.2
MARGVHALKEITMLMDTNLSRTPLGRSVGDMMSQNELLHDTKPLVMANTICWHRHPPSHSPQVRQIKSPPSCSHLSLPAGANMICKP